MTAPDVPRVLVIGIGNTYRGDDGAGLAVAEWLRGTAPPDVGVVRHEGEPISLLDTWDQVPVVYLVDAMASGAEPGSICRFDAADGLLTAGLRPRGSHALGVADAIELGRVLGRLPAGSSAMASRAAASRPGPPCRRRYVRRSPWYRSGCWPNWTRASPPVVATEFTRAALERREFRRR